MFKANSFWKICNDDEQKTITYEVHPENQTLAGLIARLPNNLRPALSAYLMNLSRELPLQHIYTTMADRPLDVNQKEIEFDIEAIVKKYMDSIDE